LTLKNIQKLQLKQEISKVCKHNEKDPCRKAIRTRRANKNGIQLSELVLKDSINIQNLFEIQYSINPCPYLETLVIGILYGY